MVSAVERPAPGACCSTPRSLTTPCPGGRGIGGPLVSTEKKKKFIIDTAYLALVLALGYVSLQFVLPLLMPFVLAFLIA